MDDKFTIRNTNNSYIKEVDIIYDTDNPIKRIKEKKRMLLLDIYKMYKICLYEHYKFMVYGLNNKKEDDKNKHENNDKYINNRLYIQISYLNNKYNISHPFFKNNIIYNYMKNKKLKNHNYQYILIKYNYKSKNKDNTSHFMFLYNFKDILEEIERMKLLMFFKNILEIVKTDLNNISKQELNKELIISPFIIGYNDLDNIVNVYFGD